VSLTPWLFDRERVELSFWGQRATPDQGRYQLGERVEQRTALVDGASPA
jgi:hypothetical protein